MNKKVIQSVAFIAFIGVAITALYYGGVFGNSSSQSQDNTQRTAQKVHILKYSDYQCPACKAYIPLQEQLKAEFGDMIEIEYRYFPLRGHQYADLAARAAEAARQQGKFEEMHDLIFEYQEQWSQGGARDYFFDFAEQIGLDMDQFESDLESEEVQQTVNSQLQEGIRRTVNSTPTFFLNGQKLRQNPQSYEQFKAIVELYMYRSDG
ncbi:MAG: thioredoxin domain-containing protein [Balneolaceae bacterium]|nr:thioredoxin domain-containing protein [Balneolaceae bacterium]